jgi:hypothetical protein
MSCEEGFLFINVMSRWPCLKKKEKRREREEKEKRVKKMRASYITELWSYVLACL